MLFREGFSHNPIFVFPPISDEPVRIADMPQSLNEMTGPSSIATIQRMMKNSLKKSEPLSVALWSLRFNF